MATAESQSNLTKVRRQKISPQVRHVVPHRSLGVASLDGIQTVPTSLLGRRFSNLPWVSHDVTCGAASTVQARSKGCSRFYPGIWPLALLAVKTLLCTAKVGHRICTLHRRVHSILSSSHGRGVAPLLLLALVISLLLLSRLGKGHGNVAPARCSANSTARQATALLPGHACGRAWRRDMVAPLCPCAAGVGARRSRGVLHHRVRHHLGGTAAGARRCFNPRSSARWTRP